MKDFGRTLRIATRYRWTLLGIVASSMLVALFWGANLGSIYPIVDVVLKGRSLQQWVDDNVAQAEITSAKLRVEIDQQRDAETKQAAARLASLTRRLKAEQSSLEGTWLVPGYRRLQPWIHGHMPDRPYPTLIIVVVALLIGTVCKTTFLVINVILVQRIAQLVTFDLRKQLYRHTVGLELSKFSDEGTSKLVTHFTHDMQAVAASMNTVFGRAIREPLKIIACLLGAIFICWRLLLLSLLISPLAIYLINRLAKSVKRASHRAMDGMADLFGVLDESLNGIKLVKAYTSERVERHRFHVAAKNYMRKALKVGVYNAFNKPITELMGMFTVAVAILTGGYLVLNEETHLGFLQMSQRPLNFGSLMTFFALLAGVSDPFRKLSDVYNEIQRGAAAADRVFARIDTGTNLHEPVSPAKMELPLAHLTFHQVDFAYQPDWPVLHDVSFTLEAGETLAIVGPNGCGKSSLLNLILRFYDPTSGSIRWNGTDIKTLRRRDLRRQMGLVTQQAMLFDDTIANNIRYGSADATDAQLVAAAKQAHAHQFITEKLSSGYQTPVGQGGKLLSGGQRQRISLARAILRDPQLLLLDEATSQIDVASEQLIRQTLAKFTRQRTTIMITHRMETLSLADRIMVLDGGRIVDVGAHRELMDRCALYRHLHQSQFKVPA
jgi:ATP-binding cassette subfamily B protein/subfamily B ATP-binding cassette protein MsbA